MSNYYILDECHLRIRSAIHLKKLFTAWTKYQASNFSNLFLLCILSSCTFGKTSWQILVKKSCCSLYRRVQEFQTFTDILYLMLVIALMPEPQSQGWLIAHRPTGCNVLNSYCKPAHKFRLWEICMNKIFKIHGKVQ